MEHFSITPELLLERERVTTVRWLQVMLQPVENAIIDPVSPQLLQSMKSKLKKIRKAQLRMSNGQYGICRDCQQPIEPERLEAIPYTERCALCKGATSGQNGSWTSH